MSEIETVGQAQALPNSWLSVRCDACRVLHLVPWNLLPGLKEADRIDWLHRRLKCRHCGARPTAENVSVYVQTSGPTSLYGPATAR